MKEFRVEERKTLHYNTVCFTSSWIRSRAEKGKISGRKAVTMTEENIETIRQMIEDDYL